MKGNIALCEGAIAAGVKGFFGYPITPQNEIPAHMSKRLPELGRVFLQAESEIAAINMVLGATTTGYRAMTSSSSPGISLKQEGISYIAGLELPAVIVNVQRGGPGLGNIAGSQSDYFQSTKGGGHGDYRLIVLAPNSVQEMYDFGYLSFDLAEKYRNPVLILSDGIVGQMMEPVVLGKKIKEPPKLNEKWVLDGAKNREPRFLRSLMMEEGFLEEHNWHLKEKYDRIAKHEVRFEEIETRDADIILVAFGISSRVAKSAVRTARKSGIKAGLLRPITLWPFPHEALLGLAKPGNKFLVVEMNLGQMVEDVRLAVNGKCPVDLLSMPGGSVINEIDVLNKIKAINGRS
jgi:2-oxoglutarate ferredoxin oxidoreductase subunit alpha